MNTPHDSISEEHRNPIPPEIAKAVEEFSADEIRLLYARTDELNLGNY